MEVVRLSPLAALEELSYLCIGPYQVSRFSLEVEASFVEGAENDVTEQLDSVLGIIVTTHGGIAVEASDSPTRLSYKRHFVNILDCDNLLEKELEWFTKRFPGTRFTLKEYQTAE